MSLTKPQEEYLANLADKGLAEQAESVERNEQIVLDTKIQEARAIKTAELEAEAKALVDAGLEKFETEVVPTITIK